jgi:anti-sigma B factor antagonist
MPEQRFFIRGEIDMSTAPALRTSLRDTIEHHEGDLVVDCCGLTFMDSAGVSILIATARSLESKGHSLRVVNVDNLTARLVDIMGVADILNVSSS